MSLMYRKSHGAIERYNAGFYGNAGTLLTRTDIIPMGAQYPGSYRINNEYSIINGTPRVVF